MKSKGLGDSIRKFTYLTGIESLTEYLQDLTGLDCGCDKRRNWLNKQFPYKITKKDNIKTIKDGNRNR